VPRWLIERRICKGTLLDHADLGLDGYAAPCRSGAGTRTVLGTGVNVAAFIACTWVGANAASVTARRYL
jgi:hypothetical protein